MAQPRTLPLRGTPFIKRRAAIMGLLAVAIGIGVVVFISAAGSHASVEAETGARTSPAVLVQSAGASGGQAVRFGGSAAPGTGTGNNPPPAAAVTVDFRTATHALDGYALGSTISTFAGGGQANINKSAAWRDGLAALGPLAWRIPLRYNNGNPGSSAQGAQTSGDAAAYIQNIKAIGGIPVVVVGGQSDNDFSDADAAGLVRYFNDNGGQHGGPVKHWVIGNEYTNPGNDPIGYMSRLRGWAAAMKAADPTIKLSAPAHADMKYAEGSIAQAVQQAAEYLDFLSYHGYAGDSAGLNGTKDYRTWAEYYTNKYITTQNFGARASQVKPSLEEFNWAPYGVHGEYLQWQNTVFTASVIGHSLSGGARAFQFADSAGDLGLMNDTGAVATKKYPAYWGMSMWTGLGGQFRRASGRMVATSSSLSGIEAFATDNGKIVLVNKGGADQAVTVGLGGKTTGVYTLWQTNKNEPFAAPVRKATAAPYAGSALSLTLPSGSVSSIEL